MNTLTIFFLVSLLSTATPGPAVIYVTSQGVAGGMRSAAPAGLGVLAADAFYIVLSVTGLSAILAASFQLFTLMKWAGAAYLVYLGVRLLLSACSRSSEASGAAAPIASRRSMLSGFALHAANPKALLYFGALVPQFVDPAGALGPQLATLAAIHLGTAASVLLAYAMLSSGFRRSRINGRIKRVFTAAAGSSLIAAGVSMALVRKNEEGSPGLLP
ncbi:MAG: LysE family translocator [Steroidobacter sp.]